ncbi:hypothetical protein B0H21DRAFT_862719 [Amylocystis lapponica]|nr:hypothetical protein B0H21DRAFT_862719 [Amylocystis lapponica]
MSPQSHTSSRRSHNPYRLSCPVCKKECANTSGLTQHYNHAHVFRPPSRLDDRQTDSADYVGQHDDSDYDTPNTEGTSQRSRREYHPFLNGRPCDQDGTYLPEGSQPPPRPDPSPDDWSPYDSRIEFETAEFMYKKTQMSNGNINVLLDLWAASLLPHGDTPPFANHDDLHNIIDSTILGDVPWSSFAVSYTGDVPQQDAPPWMSAEYEVWYRDPREVARIMLQNPDFDGEIDWTPYRESTDDHGRRYQDFMSGDWVWKHANMIAEDPSTHGASFIPIILGSDKTTVSVATGQNEYYPLYMSIGNVHNNVRRAHRNALVLIGFLAVPKTERKYANTARFRKFRRQLFHSSLSAILQSLRRGMTTPEVTKCADGHFRRVIYGLGPYIADYPEQVLVSCIVQGWCPSCDAHHSNLAPGADRRTRLLTEALINAMELKLLWDDYGIVGDIVPFTNDFPRADIHELLSGDLLHQIIKGAFKDHLVTWVGEYLVLVHGEARAKEILDEIDRRISAVPLFPGLRHFHEGRDFKQWTGDDSKALMKIYLPAIAGLVPDEIVRTLSTFLEVCYLVRRSVLDDTALRELEDALSRFRQHRQIFQDSGVRPTGFSLPRMHALDHYLQHIRQFAAPNGLCSSITEAKHIKAVKEPWRRSNRHQPLGQMLLTNQRLDKLAASKADFAQRGMLEDNNILFHDEDGPDENECESLGSNDANEHKDADMQDQDDDDNIIDGEDDVEDDDNDEDDGAVLGPSVLAHVELAKTPARRYPHDAVDLGNHIGHPRLPDLLRRFLYFQLNPDSLLAPSDVPISSCPFIAGRISVYHSAVAMFYAPSDISGLGGMRRERIRATPVWRGDAAGRYDCAYIENDATKRGLRGLHVGRVRLFMLLRHRAISYPCALIEWFVPISQEPDPNTGMWIVEPEFDADGSRTSDVIHVDSIMRNAHLIPVFGDNFLPHGFRASDSLDAFQVYFVNKFADHHAHEVAF